jgi:hypothetical protein
MVVVVVITIDVGGQKILEQEGSHKRTSHGPKRTTSLRANGISDCGMKSRRFRLPTILPVTE